MMQINESGFVSGDNVRRRRVALHAAAVAIVWAINFVGHNPALTLIAGGSFITLVYLKFGRDELRTALLRLNPLSFYFLWYSVVLGFSAIYAGYLMSSGEALSLAGNRVAPGDIATGYLIFLAGSTALHAGFQYFRPGHQCDRIVSGFRSNTAFLASLAVMYVSGLLVLLFPSVTDPLGGALSSLTHLAPIAALSCFVLAKRELAAFRITFVVVLLLGTVGLIIGSLNSGSKSDLMFSFLPLFWFILVYHPRWLPVAGAAGLLLYSVIWQVISLSRLNSRYYADVQSVTRAPELANQVVYGFEQWLHGARIKAENSDDVSSNLGPVDQFLRRQFQPLPVGLIARQVHEGGILMGRTLDYVAYASVPRILWPEKPRVIRGGWFTFYLGIADSPDSATTNTAQYAAGELYWNFGLLGVLLGMALLGALSGGLWRMAGNDPHRSPLRMILYVMVILSLQEMPEAGTMLVGIIAQFMVFGGIFVVQRAFVQKKPAAVIPAAQLEPQRMALRW